VLVDKSSLLLSNVHVVGFSLGAHVSGYAGSELNGLRRITGLDPAGPLFESQHPKARLDETDAEFVDVIHSNGENLILGGLGSWQPMGDADFYPNGGKIQHGCSNIFVGAVSDIIWGKFTGF
jgi:pancreatic lipase-related protein 1